MIRRCSAKLGVAVAGISAAGGFEKCRHIGQRNQCPLSFLAGQIRFPVRKPRGTQPFRQFQARRDAEPLPHPADPSTHSKPVPARPPSRALTPGWEWPLLQKEEEVRICASNCPSVKPGTHLKGVQQNHCHTHSGRPFEGGLPRRLREPAWLTVGIIVWLVRFPVVTERKSETQKKRPPCSRGPSCLGSLALRELGWRPYGGVAVGAGMPRRKD